MSINLEPVDEIKLNTKHIRTETLAGITSYRGKCSGGQYSDEYDT